MIIAIAKAKQVRTIQIPNNACFQMRSTRHRTTNTNPEQLTVFVFKIHIKVKGNIFYIFHPNICFNPTSIT